MWTLFRRAAIKWYADDCLTLGAGLAYYTVFSLAPVLVIVIAVAGAVFGPEAAQGEIVGQIRGLVGDEGATAIQSMVTSASRQSLGPRATAIGLAILLFGSTSAFSQLQSSLNRIWEVEPSTRGGIWPLVRARVLSFAAVLGTGFLLSVSLVLSAAVAALGHRGWDGAAPQGSLLEGADFLGSMVVHTLLFAMIFRMLPDTEIRWRDVWLGAACTAGLFVVGKVVIGLYLGRSDVGAAYGAASWVILVLAWVYYSAEIVLFGAEFTYAHAQMGRAPRSPLPAAEAAGRGASLPPPTSPRSRRPPS